MFAVAPAANAAVTVGSNLQDAADISYNCNDTQRCTVRLADAAPASQAPGGLISPVSGVVVRWRVNVGAFVSPLFFRIIRPAGSPGQFTGAGTSASVTPLINSTNTFEVAMPIQAGDSIGVNCCQMGDDQIFRLVTAGQALQQTWGIVGAPLADGEPPRAPDGSSNIIQLMINADIEPDCDADGLGDETQDPDTSSCNPQPQPKADGTLTIDANKGKVEKGRKVTLSGQYDVVTNEACEPSRTVEIQRRLKSEPGTAFATFKTVQTDAAGNFSTKQKVKKTYVYRALVQENASCDDELSNTQKVRVRKKKAAQEA